MFDDQHDCHAFVGSSVLPCKPARMRVALSATAGILSALAPLLFKETVFILLVRKSTCPIVICPEPEVAVIDFEFPFLCGFGLSLLRLLLR